MSDKKDGEVSFNGNVSRRKLLQMVGVSGSGSGLGIGLDGSDEDDEDDDRVKITKSEGVVDQEELEELLESQLTQNLHSLISDIEVEEAESVRINTHIDDQQMIHSYKVPTSIGELSIASTGSTVRHAAIQLDREAVTPEWRRLARNIGWPSGTTASLIAKDSGTAFVREPTETEIEECVDLIDRDDDPFGVTATREMQGGAGEYVVRFTDKVYYIHHNRKRIKRVEEPGGGSGDGKGKESGGPNPNDDFLLGHGPGCYETGEHCMFDIASAIPHCGVGLWCCGFGPIACIICMLDLCAPNVALIYVSGNCEWVYNNCL